MFVDTSGFLCKNKETEIYHEKAGELYDSPAIRLTTNYVLAEYVALAQVRGVPRHEIIKFSTDILSDKKTEIVWVDEDLHRRAIELPRNREDKLYSLCDAVSSSLTKPSSVAVAKMLRNGKSAIFLLSLARSAHSRKSLSAKKSDDLPLPFSPETRRFLPLAVKSIFKGRLPNARKFLVSIRMIFIL